jgi:hypothetical protein
VARFDQGGTRLIDGHMVTGEEPSPLTPERRRLIDALRVAREALGESEARLCADANPNTVVLPPASPDGPVLVYFMTPATETGRYPMGGHYRVAVSADGKVAETRPFAKSCLVVERGERSPVAMVVSHLLDPTPTEIHVFTMFAARLPIYVMTASNERLWVVESSGGQARIRLLDQKEK